MTREECKQLIMVCEATYPNSRTSNPQETLNAWFFILEEFDYQTIMAALKIYIHTSNSAFAPSVSQLIAMARKPKELTAPQEVDIWREIRPAIRNGIYHAEEEFEKLSPMAQRMVGDAGQIREWAQLPSEDIDTVIQSNFKKRCEAMIKRNKEIAEMPKEVRLMIESVNVSGKQIEASSWTE